MGIFFPPYPGVSPSSCQRATQSCVTEITSAACVWPTGQGTWLRIQYKCQILVPAPLQARLPVGPPSLHPPPLQNASLLPLLGPQVAQLGEPSLQAAVQLVPSRQPSLQSAVAQTRLTARLQNLEADPSGVHRPNGCFGLHPKLELSLPLNQDLVFQQGQEMSIILPGMEFRISCMYTVLCAPTRRRSSEDNPQGPDVRSARLVSGTDRSPALISPCSQPSIPAVARKGRCGVWGGALSIPKPALHDLRKWPSLSPNTVHWFGSAALGKLKQRIPGLTSCLSANDGIPFSH